ncbi:MAG: hypothetical protein J3Q66DRAFT_444207 [Benniella sp.]|nr:MAG: hypothetical protein J3Q66DRAFT_444207 [Benniella sp.]
MKSPHRHLRLVFGIPSISILFVFFLAARRDALDTLLQQHTYQPLSAITTADSLTIAPRTLWDPHQKYLVYLPFEGISNQFYSLQNAATIAKRLNRTLVVPPITSNRHDRLGTHQPWSRYMDLEYMSIHSGVRVVEWHTIKHIDPVSQRIIDTGSRTRIPRAWKQLAERLPCQVVRNYGHDYFVGQKDSIGADFAYQFLLDLKPTTVPGFTFNDMVSYVGDIVKHNQDSTDPVVCLTFTFTAQFTPDRNRWDIAWEDVGQHIRFLPRLTSYVEDLIADRFGRLKDPARLRPPLNLGISMLDKGTEAKRFLAPKPWHRDYIAIHLRRGDIGVKCANQTLNDCVIPLPEYKAQVEGILARLPKHARRSPPNVVLVSDTRSGEEKAVIDSYGWYRLDHDVDPHLLNAAKILGPFSPALIDSAVLSGPSARWVIGSRRSTMSWLAGMRISSWYNRTIIYPQPTAQQMADDQQGHSITNRISRRKRSEEVLGKRTRALYRLHEGSEQVQGDNNNNNHDDDDIVTWDRQEGWYFDRPV